MGGTNQKFLLFVTMKVMYTGFLLIFHKAKKNNCNHFEIFSYFYSPIQ